MVWIALCEGASSTQSNISECCREWKLVMLQGETRTHGERKLPRRAPSIFLSSSPA
jgi:hypothetical protein